MFERDTDYGIVRMYTRADSDDLDVCKSMFTYSGRKGEYFRLFTDEIIEFLECTGSDTLWMDAGAHLGDFSVRVAIQFGNRSVAYEPVSESVELCLKNAELNGISDKISCVHAAVGDKACEDAVLKIGQRLQSATLLKEPRGADGYEIVDVLDIFEELSKIGANCIKLDIEGSEASILLDDRFDEVALHTDVLVVEYHAATLGDRHYSQYWKIIAKLEKLFEFVLHIETKSNWQLPILVHNL